MAPAAASVLAVAAVGLLLVVSWPLLVPSAIAVVRPIAAGLAPVLGEASVLAFLLIAPPLIWAVDRAARDPGGRDE